MSPRLLPWKVCSYLRSERKDKDIIKRRQEDQCGKWKLKNPSHKVVREANKHRHTHMPLSTTPQTFIITEPGNILFPLWVKRTLRNLAPAPHLSQAAKWTMGSLQPKEKQPHLAGNGSGAAGADTWGAQAKRAACPSPTRPSKATLCPSLTSFMPLVWSYPMVTLLLWSKICGSTAYSCIK